MKKVMLITGGGRGIGAATALLAAKQDYVWGTIAVAGSFADGRAVRFIVWYGRVDCSV